MRSMNRLALMIALVVTALPAMAEERKCDSDVEYCVKYIIDNFEGKGWLGVELNYPEGEVPEIVRVLPDSPAAKAGLREGDYLLAFNGVRYATATETALAEARKALVPGNRFEVTIERDGRERVLEVTAANVPQSVLAQWIGEHLLYQHRHQIADADPE